MAAFFLLLNVYIPFVRVERYGLNMACLWGSFIYSADAEFIRIKNYYRIGTEDSIEQARLKINAARRIYPNDVRFPNIFFLSLF